MRYLMKHCSKNSIMVLDNKVHKKFYFHIYLLQLNPVTELVYRLNRCPFWIQLNKKQIIPSYVNLSDTIWLGLYTPSPYTGKKMWEFRENHTDLNVWQHLLKESFIETTAVLEFWNLLKVLQSSAISWLETIKI